TPRAPHIHASGFHRRGRSRPLAAYQGFYGPTAETTRANAPRSVFRPASASYVLAGPRSDSAPLLDPDRNPFRYPHQRKWFPLQSQSSVESASRTTRISVPIKEAPAVVLQYGEDALPRAEPKDRVRAADSTELWDWHGRSLHRGGSCSALPAQLPLFCPLPRTRPRREGVRSTSTHFGASFVCR
ncbi:MAG: hypothetical protein RL385_3775, partial [Pseudomonadota bacterium]